MGLDKLESQPWKKLGGYVSKSIGIVFLESQTTNWNATLGVNKHRSFTVFMLFALWHAEGRC